MALITVQLRSTRSVSSVLCPNGEPSLRKLALLPLYKWPSRSSLSSAPMANEPLASGHSRCYTVFIDTNLDTHLAMTVSEEDTVRDLKCKIMIEHPNYFPNIGQISVHALKVKRKAQFYHLSDTMLVINAFTGVKGTWFLHADAASGQVRPIKDLQYLDPGASKPPHSFCTASGPAAETERNNLQIDYPLARVSNLKDLISPQVGSRDLVNPVAPPDDLFGPGNKVGESQTGMDQGVKHVTEENSKPSSIDANEKHLESETLKRNDAAGKEKDALESNTERKKYNSRKRLRQVSSDNMLEDSPKSGSVVKKKCAPEKKVEDAFRCTVKSPSKHTDFGTYISSKESLKPEEELSQNCSKDKNKTTDAFMDGSLSKELENDSSFHSLLNGEKKELSKLQDVLDSRGISCAGDIVQGHSKEALGNNHEGLDKESEAGMTIEETICRMASTDHTTILNKEKNDSPVQDEGEGNLISRSSLVGPHVASELAIENLEGETGGSKVDSRKNTSELTTSYRGMKAKKLKKCKPACAKDPTPSLVEEVKNCTEDVTISTCQYGDENNSDDLIDKTEKVDGVLPQNEDPKLFSSSATNSNLVSNEAERETKNVSNNLDASGIIEAGDPHDKRKKRSKKTKSADAKNLGRENSPGNAITLRLERNKASECDKLGDETELSKLAAGDAIDDMTYKTVKENKPFQQNGDPELMSSEATRCNLLGRDKAVMNVKGLLDLSCRTEVVIPSEKRKKISKKTKVSDAMGHALSSGLENAIIAGDSIPLRPGPDKALDSDHPGDKTSRRDTILFQREKTEVSKILDAASDDNIQDETDKKEKEEKVLLQSDHRVACSEANKLNCKLLGTDETDMTIKDEIESSLPLYASGIIESGGPNHKGRKKSKKSMTSDSKSRVSSSVAEHIDAAGEVIPPRSVPDKAFDSVHPGDKTDREDDVSFLNEKIETDLTDKEDTKPISFVTSAFNCKSLAMDESGLNTKDGIGSSTPSDASFIIDSGDPAHKIKKKSKKSKVSDKKSHGLSSGVEHTDASNRVNPFVDGHSAGEANGENIFLSPTETGKNLKIGYSGFGDGIIDNAQTDRVEVEESLLQKEQPNMSSEAVISTAIEAQDLSDKRRKRSKKTRASKAKSHVSTSGVEHVDSAEEILPLVSEAKQAFDGGNPCDGTNKKEEYISPHNGEMEAPAMKSLNEPLIGSGKQDDLGNCADDLKLPQIPKVEETAAFTDGKVKGKSTKSGQHSTSVSDPPAKQEVAGTGDSMLPTDGNKEEENASSKNLKKTRSRKKVLVKELSETIPESSQQYETPDNKGSSQTILDALDNNKGRPLVAGCEDEANNHVDSDKVNFIDYFVSKQDHHEVASSAKETLDKDAHIRKNNEMNAGKKNQKLNGHFRAALHDKENSLDSVDSQQKKKKHLIGSFDASQLQGSLKKDKQVELAVRPNEKGNAAAKLRGQNFHDHDRLKSLPHKDSKRKAHDASGVLSSVLQFHSPSGAKARLSSKKHNATLETSSSSTENSQDSDYKKNREAKSKANQDRAPLRKTNNKKMGKVVNSSNKKESLLTTIKTIFKDSSDSDKSFEVDGEVNYSETSTRTPDNSSLSDYSEGENATDLDSPRTGPYGRKRQENDGKHISQSQRSNMTMDMIFRSSSSYKKAKLAASQAQVDDTESPPVDLVPDSQA